MGKKNTWPKQPALLQCTLSDLCVLGLSINSIIFDMYFSVWISYCVLWCSDWDTQTAPLLKYPGALPQWDWHLLTSRPGSGWALPGFPGSTLITWLRWLSSCGLLHSLLFYSNCTSYSGMWASWEFLTTSWLFLTDCSCHGTCHLVLPKELINTCPRLNWSFYSSPKPAQPLVLPALVVTMYSAQAPRL